MFVLFDQITARLFNGRTVALPAALPTTTALRQRMGGHRWGRRSGQNAMPQLRRVDAIDLLLKEGTSDPASPRLTGWHMDRTPEQLRRLSYLRGRRPACSAH
jgi:hypothetical protein